MECGKGAFACVMAQEIKGVGRIAVKNQYPIRSAMSGIMNMKEADIMSRVSGHPSIIERKVIMVNSPSLKTMLRIGMELADGSLSDLLKNEKITSRNALMIVTQILLGLEWISSKRVVHRDLSMRNILFKKSESNEITATICDFGYAENLQKMNREPSEVTTRNYRAPELELRVRYDERVDVWAMGCIAYELFTGNHFISSSKDTDLLKMYLDTCMEPETDEIRKFLHRSHRTPRREHSLPSDVRDFLCNLLRIIPETRYTATQALNHPLIQSDEECSSHVRRVRQQFPPSLEKPTALFLFPTLCDIALKSMEQGERWCMNPKELLHGLRLCARVKEQRDLKELLVISTYIFHKYFNQLIPCSWDRFKKESGVSITPTRMASIEVKIVENLDFKIYESMEDVDLKVFLRAHASLIPSTSATKEETSISSQDTREEQEDSSQC